jgi:single-strand DNA-binding protein
MRKIILIGHLGKDAIVREVSGKSAINFNIADSEKYKDKEGVEHQKTTWFDCTIWRQNPQETKIAQFLKKGNQVYVEGIPDSEIYTTESGERRIQNRVKVTQVQLLSSKQEPQIQNQQTSTPATPPAIPQDNQEFQDAVFADEKTPVDDLPF